MPINTKTILVVDSDKSAAENTRRLLIQYGFNALVARDSETMFAILQRDAIHLVVLELGAPGLGLEICTKLRAKSQVPVIIVSELADASDRIVGLEMGADDYMGKPINPRELVARIKAVLRRSAGEAEHVIKSTSVDYHFAGWVLNKAMRYLTSPQDQRVDLSSGEFDLLMAFVLHPRRVLSRDQLLDFTKNRQAGPFDRSIDIQVSRLRQKIESNPKQPEIIITVRSGGYMFSAEVEVK